MRIITIFFFLLLVMFFKLSFADTLPMGDSKAGKGYSSPLVQAQALLSRRSKTGSHSTISAGMTDQTIHQLLSVTKNLSLEERIIFFSNALLDKPYKLEPLGEGVDGAYNQEPLYRLDCFDCETYVNTVIALALSNNLAEFQTNIRKINYVDSKVTFTNRFHFTDEEWVPNNIKNGFIEEITQNIAAPHDITEIKTYLNRKNWYYHLELARIKIPALTPQEQKVKLQQLRSEGHNMQNTYAGIRYIPLSKLFANNQPNLTIFNNIPNAAVILFVHYDPADVKTVGTHVNISHMGLIIWKNHQPYLRNASLLKGQTIDLPLINYLQAYLTNPLMKGVAFFRVIG